ncbi:S1C family serine protease [Holdemania massiliensis]|uniref:Trypsin-like serine protease n=1 Tax=Holdemania massiliensis TaxID=1468449 RepID=A0A6N7SAE9_9FIRM|nr:trypsin-like peptidase domain-containing protein [Holdemania massiliensis]MSA72262.1 trypsin-like serine protease [Holdemania massiliensis]MSA90538.1 trypsin-like serine protease [Holdemania massiliensis]MSB79344.1 trypsin-like serine protease [Holdemania massiliensis]MSC34268.1 trypsin-like serine protease [Holdemania massiliensis]MSC40658.1 trypsin-like serine protease [Holdemania massiliensis]
MFDHELMDTETAAVKKELRSMKRTFRIGLAACALLSGVIGFSAGTMAAKNSKASVVVQSVERRPQNVENVPVTSMNIPSVAALTQNSVVEIRTESVTNSLFLRQFVTEGAGSGVIISEDGYIVTNNHVIEDARSILVALHDGTTYEAQLVATDSKMDIGVIKIEASGLTPAILGDSDSLSVGEPVVAVGNPLGQLGGTVTNGIVSALDREIILNNEHRNLLQTNAAINPGNSGGGLFNADGELIGIVVAKSSGEDVEGLGFAIPINDAKPIIEDLIAQGYVGGRVSLGITALDLTTPQLAAQYGFKTPGVYVQSVIENSSAANGGLQPGDCFVSINDTAIEAISDITSILNESSVGDQLEITVKRDGKIVELTLTLQEKKG